jgi:hypothetical protein
MERNAACVVPIVVQYERQVWNEVPQRHFTSFHQMIRNPDNAGHVWHGSMAVERDRIQGKGFDFF